jgi:hypothetical protein
MSRRPEGDGHIALGARGVGDRQVDGVARALTQRDNGGRAGDEL